MKRQFTKSREELDALAVDRAAKIVRDIFGVLEKSGHAPYVSLDGAAGAAGLLAVAHAAYKEATMEVELEHEVREPFLAGLEPSEYVSPPTMVGAHTRLTRLRSVGSARSRVARPVGKLHDDGSPCDCDPACDCHPPTRNEDAIVTGERGSWHLDTCPASPKNRGKERP